MSLAGVLVRRPGHQLDFRTMPIEGAQNRFLIAFVRAQAMKPIFGDIELDFE